MDSLYGIDKDKKKRFNFSDFIALVILVIAIYTLAISHSSMVTEACGPELWNVLLARILCSVFLFTALFCFTGVVATCTSPIFRMGFVILMWFASSLTFMALEAVYASRAMASSLCMAALDSTHAHMLPIMVFVYMALDCAMLLLLICGLCCIWMYSLG